MKNAPVIATSRMRLTTDGNGVRTLVVFYKCPLRCKYCLNPQTISSESNPKIYSSQELFSTLKIDDLYFRATNGGVTFGGGEPLLYPEFIREVMGYAPDWSFWVETSLNVPYENIEMVAPFIDKFVIDIKSGDDETYLSYTGISSRRAKANLIKLVQKAGHEKIIVRVPDIPNYSSQESIFSTVSWLQNIGIRNIDRFTYRISPQ